MSDERKQLEVIFLLGAPRSGTTWLQELLAQHPAIASSQETKLYHEFINPMWTSWKRQPLEDEDRWRRLRFTGLGCILTEEEFVAMARMFAESVYERVLALKPGSRIILDKDPPNNRYVELLISLFPEGKFVHLIRDGREVAASLVDAHRGWGESWAPRTVASAARIWREHVEGARTARKGRLYTEVRFEDLKGDPTNTLRELLICLGLPCSEGLVTEMISKVDRATEEDAPLRRLVWNGEAVRRGYTLSEPGGFSGGQRPNWRAWSRRERVRFEVVSGSLLSELNYGLSERNYGRPRRSVGRLAWLGLATASECVRRRIRGPLKRRLGHF
jgi:hypothetical protein